MNSKERRKYNRVWKYCVTHALLPDRGVSRWFEYCDELVVWCNNNVTSGDWIVKHATYKEWKFMFKNESDAVLFRLMMA